MSSTNPTELHQPRLEVEPGTILVGKYKLGERIGDGGMGSVWVAQQSEPVKRKVAIKLIKPGMDSRQVLARFEAERQALAMMDHPHIAKVLDGGLTADGRPFFVMELVKGVPITQYCDSHKLTPRERLELFVPVCHAIQHAHQKGIIHRDIKPSNVQIALYDDKPVAKVIDFGVAKATGGTLTEHTLDTSFGGVVGTPQYMSPEQATLNNLDIDTRSDVYSLGVLLYELLAGSPPFTKEELEKQGLLEVLRTVREKEPPKPSTKLSSAATLPALSASRGTGPRELTGILRNELDWIVMKALEKDRSRRYETPNGLAADINRYLTGEPIVAHPPSAGYRLRKFVRRHRAEAIAAGLVLFALLAGIAGTTWGLFQAKQYAEAERLAKLDAQAEKAIAVKSAEAAKLANAQAQKRLAQIAKANEILGSIFMNLDPKEIAKNDRPLQAVLVDKLDKAIEQLEGESVGDPLVVAAMQNRFGLSLLRLGEPKKAIVVLEKARDTYVKGLGTENAETLSCMHNLAWAYYKDKKYEMAIGLHEQTLKLRKAILGPDHPDTLNSMNYCAEAYLAAGKQKLAEPLFEETLKLRKEKLGVDHPDTLISMNNLAVAYGRAGKEEISLALIEETYKLMKAKLGPEHPDTLYGMVNLGEKYMSAGKREQGLALLAEAYRIANSTLGPSHPDTLAIMDILAASYKAADKVELAIPLREQAYRLRNIKLGPDHPDTIASMNTLLAIYQANGKSAQALALFETMLAQQKIRLGPNNRIVLDATNSLSAKYLAVAARQAWMGKEKDYWSTCENALKFAADTNDAGSAERVAKICSLRPGDGKLRDEALALGRRAVELGKDMPFFDYYQMALGMAEYRSGDFVEADETLTAAMNRGKNNGHVSGTSGFYKAMGLFRQGKDAEARQIAIEAASKMKKLPENETDPEKINADELILWMAFKEARELIKFEAPAEK